MTTRQEPMKSPSSQQALKVLGGAMAAGLASVPIYATQVSEAVSFQAVLSVGLLIAGTSCFAGGTLGFLFGIPRTLQQGDRGEDADKSAAAGNGPSTSALAYRANTNLEQISDWLSKILVGVGLTQLENISSGLAKLTEFAAGGLDAGVRSQVFVGSLICFFLIVGFLFGYLWARLFLASAMRAADQELIGALADRVQAVAAKVDSTQVRLDELRKQTLLDAEALNTAHRVLNPVPDLPPVTQDDLNVAVAKASVPLKVQLFNQAQGIRGESWRTDKGKMERAIPIFRALIHGDPDNKFHRNHGQLGFALKDKQKPDFEEADRELSRAIEMRGSWRETGWLFYEFNRAICRIQLDKGFQQRTRSSAESKKTIIKDLAAANQAQGLDKLIKSDETIKLWMELNEVSPGDLGRR